LYKQNPDKSCKSSSQTFPFKDIYHFPDLKFGLN
jgi:hypothetical protein